LHQHLSKVSCSFDRKDPDATSRLSILIEGCDVLLDGRDIDAADCPALDLAAIPGIGDPVADEEKKARRAIIPITIGDEAGFAAGP